MHAWIRQIFIKDPVIYEDSVTTQLEKKTSEN